MMKLASLARRPAGEMNLVGGRLFLDFVNTVGARHNSRSKEKTVHDDKLNDYCDLLAWGQHVKLLSEAEVRTLAREASRRPQEASAVFKRAIQLREALYRICRAIRTKGQPEQPCLDVINEELRVARGRERLVSDKALFSLKCDAPISALDRVLWFVTQSAAEWLCNGSPVVRSTISPMIFFAACSVSVPLFAKRSARSIERQTSIALSRSVCFVDFLSRCPSALV